MIPQVDILQSFTKFNLIAPSKNADHISRKKVNAVVYWLSHFGVPLVLKCTGDNTEKIWVHQIFPKQKTDVPKAHKMVAGGLGNAISPPVGGQ